MKSVTGKANSKLGNLSKEIHDQSLSSVLRAGTSLWYSSANKDSHDNMRQQVPTKTLKIKFKAIQWLYKLCFLNQRGFNDFFS